MFVTIVNLLLANVVSGQRQDERMIPSPRPASNAAAAPVSPSKAAARDQGKICSAHDDCSYVSYCSKKNDTCKPRKSHGQKCQGDVRKCEKGLKCEKNKWYSLFSKCTVWNVKRKNGIRLYSKCSWSHFIPLRSVSRIGYRKEMRQYMHRARI